MLLTKRKKNRRRGEVREKKEAKVVMVLLEYEGEKKRYLVENQVDKDVDVL